MAKMTLKGTRLCAYECLPAATLHQLAQLARKLDFIIINGQELTADELEHLAKESERTGEPLCFPDVIECRLPDGSDERL
jgi:ferredoxin-thioredoxin reductase catalytic subunit